jgi:hypothetical protein
MYTLFLHDLDSTYSNSLIEIKFDANQLSFIDFVRANKLFSRTFNVLEELLSKGSKLLLCCCCCCWGWGDKDNTFLVGTTPGGPLVALL